MKRLISALLAISMIVGCSTIQQKKTETPSASGGSCPQAKSSGSSKMAGLQACAIGGLAMTALCAAAGKDIEKCLALGAITCAITGTIGYQYGKRLEERRKVLQGKEQDLCARLQYARALNSDTEEFNNGLQKEVAQLTEQTDKLVPQIRAGKVSQQEIAKSKNAINERVEVTQQNVARAEAELQGLKQFRTSSSPSADLDAEITKLQGLLARAQGNTTALAAQGQRF